MMNNPQRPPLPPGIAVRLPRANLDHPFDPTKPNDSVYYDDCRWIDGTMLDAKGTGYARLLENDKVRGFLLPVLAKRAEDQVAAAGDRPVEWYFAEPEAAEVVRQYFAAKGVRVMVKWEPWP